MLLFYILHVKRNFYIYVYIHTYKGKGNQLGIKKNNTKHKQTHWKLCSNEECMLHVCVSVTVLPILKHPFSCLSIECLLQVSSTSDFLNHHKHLMLLNFWPLSVIFSTKSEIRQNNFSHRWISEDIHEIFQKLMQNIIGAQETVPLSWSIFLSIQSCPNARLFQSNPGYLSMTTIPRHPLCFSKFWMTT